MTGLAVLLAGVSEPEKLSGYEFTVVSSLAWFSTTTQLTTLIVLRTYMKTHGIARGLRVVGMLLILILLVYSVVFTVSALDDPTPFECAFVHGTWQSEELADVYTIFGAQQCLLSSYCSCLSAMWCAYKIFFTTKPIHCCLS
jgi:hypothetical protein